MYLCNPLCKVTGSPQFFYGDCTGLHKRTGPMV